MSEVQVGGNFTVYIDVCLCTEWGKCYCVQWCVSEVQREGNVTVYSDEFAVQDGWNFNVYNYVCEVQDEGNVTVYNDVCQR